MKVGRKQTFEINDVNEDHLCQSVHILLQQEILDLALSLLRHQVIYLELKHFI